VAFPSSERIFHACSQSMLSYLMFCFIIIFIYIYIYICLYSCCIFVCVFILLSKSSPWSTRTLILFCYIFYLLIIIYLCNLTLWNTCFLFYFITNNNFNETHFNYFLFNVILTVVNCVVRILLFFYMVIV